ncbi:MAG: hemerythrin domain-containing protein [Elusimicrobia bacterium]|nr:hemerythrin domain-containing protein [Elusimicrobiota bacterium]
MTPTKRAPTAGDLARVREDHAVLEDLLRRHQEALVGLDLSNALGELEEFARRVRRHIRLEEDVLLPAYRAQGEPPRGGKPEFFLDEHRKIEQKLEEILTAARGLSVGSATRGAVVSLIEREAVLKSLMSHHEEREEKTLLPCLERSLGGR